MIASPCTVIWYRLSSGEPALRPASKDTEPTAFTSTWPPFSCACCAAVRAEKLDTDVEEPVGVTASVKVQLPPPQVKVTGVLVTVVGNVQPPIAGAELSISRCRKILSWSAGFMRAFAANRTASRAPFCTDTPKTNARPVSIRPSSRSRVTGRINANSTSACPRERRCATCGFCAAR